ncbi:MAG: hypothetical protein WAU36_03105 [Cyclobacteriaceae bacterium]
MDEWSIASEKFVAFFDVMGFKDFVYTHPHSEVEERILSLSNFIEVVNSDLPSPIGGLPSLNHYLKSILVSDSIILCSKGDTEKDFLCIVAAAGALLSGCIEYDIPIKGAISHGMFTCNSVKSIYVGKPLINASMIEESLEFYGCVIDHCVERKIETLGIEKFYNQLPALKVPTKDGQIRYHTFRISTQIQSETTLKRFYKTVSGRPRRYIDNSIYVYNEIEKVDSQP